MESGSTVVRRTAKRRNAERHNARIDRARKNRSKQPMSDETRKRAKRASVESVVLLPCPFCGSPGAIIKKMNGRKTVGCSQDVFGSCPVSPRVITAKNVNEAIEAWNCRALSQDEKEMKQFKESIIEAHKAALGKPTEVWDSRNIGQ